MPEDQNHRRITTFVTDVDLVMGVIIAAWTALLVVVAMTGFTESQAQFTNNDSEVQIRRVSMDYCADKFGEGMKSTVSSTDRTPTELEKVRKELALCQQVRMAAAAEDAADYAAWQFWVIGIWSVLLLSVATLAAVLAAWYASKAVVESKRAADEAANGATAAFEAVNVTQKASERELRPYLEIDRVSPVSLRVLKNVDSQAGTFWRKSFQRFNRYLY